MEGQPGEVGGLQTLEFVAGTIVSMVSGGARPGKAGRHASFLHKTDPWIKSWSGDGNGVGWRIYVGTEVCVCVYTYTHIYREI